MGYMSTSSILIFMLIILTSKSLRSYFVDTNNIFLKVTFESKWSQTSTQFLRTKSGPLISSNLKIYSKALKLHKSRKGDGKWWKNRQKDQWGRIESTEITIKYSEAVFDKRANEVQWTKVAFSSYGYNWIFRWKGMDLDIGLMLCMIINSKWIIILNRKLSNSQKFIYDKV